MPDEPLPETVSEFDSVPDLMSARLRTVRLNFSIIRISARPSCPLAPQSRWEVLKLSSFIRPATQFNLIGLTMNFRFNQNLERGYCFGTWFVTPSATH